MKLRDLLKILPDFQKIEFDGRSGFVSDLKNDFEGKYDLEISYIASIDNVIKIFERD